jgi:single-strand DNA-binding protein
MNTVNLIGRLTKDCELRYTPNGKAVAQFTLAVNRTFKNQNGDYEADFFRVVVWNKAAENAAEYLGKGSQCGVTGRLQSRSYENNQGQRVYVTEVVADNVQFLDTRNDNSNRNAQRSAQNSSTNDDPFSGVPDIDDSDLPF